jgi:hypothetical protein
MKVYHKPEVNIVYSLGPNCQTDIFLKDFNMRKFSSIFGSMSADPDKIYELLENNYRVIFSAERHIYSRFKSNYQKMNKLHGYRTIITDWDKNFDDASYPYQELWQPKTRDHFKRAICRLNKIKKYEIPTLFLYIENESKSKNQKDKWDLQKISKIKDYIEINFKSYFLAVNMKNTNTTWAHSNIHSSYDVSDDHKTQISKKVSDRFMIYQDIISAGVWKRLNDWITENYDTTNLLTIEQLDNYSK